jgi:predicted dinucleotide-binding enzyme
MRAIIGAGSVGATLGQAWLQHGEDVIWGLRNPAAIAPAV